MLDLGFREELEMLLDATPAETRRTLLFSATIAARHRHAGARTTSATPSASTPPAQTEPHGDIDYRAMRISPDDTEHAVVNVLRYLRSRRRPRLLRHARSRAPPARQPARARLPRRRPVRRDEPARAQRRAAGPARRPRPGLRRHRRRRARPRPARPRPRHPRRPADATRRRCCTARGRTGRAGRKGVSVLLVPAPSAAAPSRCWPPPTSKATWSGPPTAEEIRAQDHQRLLEDPCAQANRRRPRTSTWRRPARRKAGRADRRRADRPLPRAPARAGRRVRQRPADMRRSA